MNTLLRRLSVLCGIFGFITISLLAGFLTIPSLIVSLQTNTSVHYFLEWVTIISGSLLSFYALGFVDFARSRNNRILFFSSIVFVAISLIYIIIAAASIVLPIWYPFLSFITPTASSIECMALIIGGAALVFEYEFGFMVVATGVAECIFGVSGLFFPLATINYLFQALFMLLGIFVLNAFANTDDTQLGMGQFR